MAGAVLDTGLARTESRREAPVGSGAAHGERPALLAGADGNLLE